MNEQGTILDDLVVAKDEDSIFAVVNGACKKADLEHMRSYAGDFDVEIEEHKVWGNRLI